MKEEIILKTIHQFTKDKPKSSLAYGIDLGTTNSAIAFLGGSKLPEMITLKNGKTTMPSCVMWDSNKVGTPGEWIVGDKAYEHREEPNTCYSVKRLMGSDEKVVFKHAGKSKVLSPEEVSALILKGLVEQASKLHPNIKDVVITVPAKFTTKQVKATKAAADLAGLNVLGISKEPTAAAEAYHLESSSNGALVYDLGGGTFDVSVVGFSKAAATGHSDVLDLLGVSTDDVESQDILTVRATKGDAHLGGDDLDMLMYRKIIDFLVAHHGIDESKITLRSREALILTVSKDKLNQDFLKLEFDVRLDFTDGTKGKYLVPFTFDEYKECTREIFNRTNKFVRGVLADSSLGLKDIVLVGGSTKNLVLQEMIRKAYPDLNVYSHLNPDEAVALGAAIDAYRLKFGDDSVAVFDVIGNAIGVVADERVVPVIAQNTPIPCAGNRVLATVYDDQEEILLEVREGDSCFLEECEYLGHFIIKRPQGHKKEQVAVGVSLAVDSNGLLSCKVSVDGEEFEHNLVNVLGRGSEEKSSPKPSVDADDGLSKKDRVKFSRWEKVIKSFDDPSVVEAGLDLLADAKKDTTKSVLVAEFIRSHQQ